MNKTEKISKESILEDIEDLEEGLKEVRAITLYGENPFNRLSYLKTDMRLLMNKLAKYRTKGL